MSELVTVTATLPPWFIEAREAAVRKAVRRSEAGHARRIAQARADSGELMAELRKSADDWDARLTKLERGETTRP